MELVDKTFERNLSAEIERCALPMDLEDPKGLLSKWAFFSQQVPRLLGAVLSRSSTPEVHCLMSKNIHSECGDGLIEAAHSKLFSDLMDKSFTDTRQPVSTVQRAKLDDAITRISGMTEGESIGFLVGLEAPAYSILELLKNAFVKIGCKSDEISGSEYFVIHEAVEKTHQDDGREMAVALRRNGVQDDEIKAGANYALEFWRTWWLTS